MRKNIGGLDKAIRIILALALFSLYFILEGNAKYLATIGFVPLLTAFVSFCPIYRLFNFSTSQSK